MPAWGGNIWLSCLQIGYTRACLAYTHKGTLDGKNSPITDYTGLYVNWATFKPGGAATLYDCPMTGKFSSGAWNTLMFSIDRVNSAVNVTINGQSAIADCNPSFDTDTNGSVSLGLRANLTTTAGWSVYFDSVVASARR
jgi:hypothetical protein